MTKRNLRDRANQRVEDVDELFYNDRLDRQSLTPADYPARVDQAAIDLFYNISIGKSKRSRGNPLAGSGTVGTFDFGRATGAYYKQGLAELAGENSDLPRLIDNYEAQSVGDLSFRLNQLKHELTRLQSDTDDAQITDLTRVLEAVIEKVITRSMHAGDEEVIRRAITEPEAIADLMNQIFSDPASTAYADELIELIEEMPMDENILGILDSPEMVTPLWDHQQKAIRSWIDHGFKGYVDMATATGKTVLGLAAIATLFGRLHPNDETELDRASIPGPEGDQRVLIVAGQDLLLEQWRGEFDEHLNIPRDRTGGDERPRTITLEWGRIEFKTAQELLAADRTGSYDLVILDEAHQYSRGSRSGRGWAAILEELVDYSDAVLALSGSVDQGWLGDEAVKTALTGALPLCKRFKVAEARDAGVIANFAWTTVYAGAGDPTTEEKLATTTRTLTEAYDETIHKFDPRLVDESIPEDNPEPFETLTDLRSFGQSKAGSSLRDRSEPFDRIATAALSRRPQRWQLAPASEVVAQLVAQLAPEHKTVVLVQSYKQAEEVDDALSEIIGAEFVLVPEAGTDDQFGTITEFKKGDYQVIIGPGNVLGTGVDMPEADVAINLSKGGVNASLIQRMGRVLRNPTGDKQAKFYHVVTLPTAPDALIPGEDGRRLVRRAAEFRALGARLRELPGFVAVNDEVAGTVASLETAGVAALQADHRELTDIVDDEVAQKHLRELLDRVAERSDKSDGRTTAKPDAEPASTILAEWENETLDRTVKPVQNAVEVELEIKLDSGSESEGASAGTRTADSDDQLGDEALLDPDDSGPDTGSTDGTADQSEPTSTDSESSDTTEPEDLIHVSGITPDVETTLHDAGYRTVDDLRNAMMDELAEVDGIGRPIAARIKADVGSARSQSTEDETTEAESEAPDDASGSESYNPDWQYREERSTEKLDSGDESTDAKTEDRPERKNETEPESVDGATDSSGDEGSKSLLSRTSTKLKSWLSG